MRICRTLRFQNTEKKHPQIQIYSPPKLPVIEFAHPWPAREMEQEKVKCRIRSEKKESNGAWVCFWGEGNEKRGVWQWINDVYRTVMLASNSIQYLVYGQLTFKLGIFYWYMLCLTLSDTRIQSNTGQ